LPGVQQRFFTDGTGCAPSRRIAGGSAGAGPPFCRPSLRGLRW
jgi:hypothetical protein